MNREGGNETEFVGQKSAFYYSFNRFAEAPFHDVNTQAVCVHDTDRRNNYQRKPIEQTLLQSILGIPRGAGERPHTRML